VLDILSIPEASLSAADTAILTAARANRTVDFVITVFLGPAVSRLLVTFVTRF